MDQNRRGRVAAENRANKSGGGTERFYDEEYMNTETRLEGNEGKDHK